MTRSLLFQQVLNGLAIGSVYAIFALGYTLIFSILRIINFTHGAIFTLGAYATYALTGASFGFNGLLANASLPVRLPFVLALIGGSLFAAVCGVIVERLAFRPLRARGSDPLLTLVSSLGVAVALVNVIQYLFGAEAYSDPADPFGHLPSAVNFGTAAQPILVRTVQVIIFGVSMVVLAVLTVLMNATRTGKALRTVAEDTVTASLLGIDTDRLILADIHLVRRDARHDVRERRGPGAVRLAPALGTGRDAAVRGRQPHRGRLGGDVPVEVMFSLMIPAGRSALEFEQDLYLLWPGEVVGTTQRAASTFQPTSPPR